jgi:hypothetical protein
MRSDLARSVHDSANPGLWNELLCAWVPDNTPKVRDFSGNGNHAIAVTGSPTIGIIPPHRGVASYWLAYRGYPVRALDLRAASSAVQIGAIGGTRTAGKPFSVFAVWERTSTATGDIVGCRNGSGAGDLWKLYGSSTNTLTVEYDPTGSGASVNTASAAWDQPHSGGFTYDGSYFRLFLDGKHVSTSTLKTSAAIDQDAVWIGRRADAVGEYLVGYIGPVYIWKRAIRQSEYSLLSRDPLAPFSRKESSSFVVPAAPPAASVPKFMHHYKVRRTA